MGASDATVGNAPDPNAGNAPTATTGGTADAKESTSSGANGGGTETLAGAGPGEKAVPRSGIIIFSVALVLLSLTTLYSLWSFWPLGVEGKGSSKQNVNWFDWHLYLDREFLFFLTVALAGGLGGLIHTIRSFTAYVGERKLVWSWVPYNLILPVVGALAGTVFYLVLRAGLFSPSTSVQQASPFGFAAISILAGLFSPQAFEKLKQLSEQVFTKAPKRTDRIEEAPGRSDGAATPDESGTTS